MGNSDLVKCVEDTSKAFSTLREKRNILREKLDVAEKEINNLKSEKAGNDFKPKEIKKKHSEEVNKLQVQVKDFENKNKTNAKVIHDLQRTLENTRATLKNCKSEKSSLKICHTKLEKKLGN